MRLSVRRALYEKGVRAFVSFVQSYGKHECGLLFQVKGRWGLWVGPVGGTSGWSCWPTSVCLSLELPVGELAEGMGLLRVPAMPELRGIPVTGFSPTDLDLDSICYK